MIMSTTPVPRYNAMEKTYIGKAYDGPYKGQELSSFTLTRFGYARVDDEHPIGRYDFKEFPPGYQPGFTIVNHPSSGHPSSGHPSGTPHNGYWKWTPYPLRPPEEEEITL